MKVKMVKLGTALLAAGAITAAFSINSFASTISGIRLEIKNTEEVGLIVEPEITTGSSNYEVTSIEWAKDSSKWKPGEKVLCTVGVTATEGNEFSVVTKSNSRVGSYDIKSSHSFDETTGTIKFYYLPVINLLPPAPAGWSNSEHTIASWKAVDHAGAYQVKLFYGDEEEVTSINVDGTSVDLGKYMTKQEKYFYKVRAIGKDSTNRKYEKESEWVISEDLTVNDLGITTGHWRNYREGNKYEMPDGSMVTGWQYIMGEWYYFNNDAFMTTGWQKVNDKWYYLGEDGAMVTGWIHPEGKWYYLTQDGSMASNTVINGYQLGEDGSWIMQ